MLMVALEFSAGTSSATLTPPPAVAQYWPKKWRPEVIMAFSSYWKRNSARVRSSSGMSATRS